MESHRPSSVLSKFSKSCPPSLQPYTWATSSNTVLYPLYPLPENRGTCLANGLLVEVGMLIPASKPAPPQMVKVQLTENSDCLALLAEVFLTTRLFPSQGSLGALRFP